VDGDGGVPASPGAVLAPRLPEKLNERTRPGRSADDDGPHGPSDSGAAKSDPPTGGAAPAPSGGIVGRALGEAASHLTITGPTPTENGVITRTGRPAATFNRTLLSGQPFADRVQIRGRQSGAIGASSISGGGTQTLTYTPSRSFAPGERVRVSYRASLESDGGPTLDTTQTITYTAAAATGPATFPIPKVVSRSEGGARALAAGDLDGDGDRDLVVGSDLKTSVTRYMNMGDGTFDEGTGVGSSINNARDVLLADIDGQNGPDIVVAEGSGSVSSDDQISWFPNNGDGTFGSQQDVAVAGNSIDNPRSVAAGDIDGNGTVDIVAAGRDGSTVYWYANDGAGDFTKNTVTTAPSDPRDVAIADLDGNGTLDVAWTDVSNNVVKWTPNDGTGSFGSNLQIGGAQTALDLELADLNGENGPDVVIAASGEDAVRVAFNDGSEGFSSPTSLNTSVAGASAVHVADLNGDGSRDILAAGGTDHSLYAFLNQGEDSFATSGAFETGAGQASDVIAADVDGDNRLDPVATAYADSTVTFYPNVQVGPTIYVDKDASGGQQYGTSWPDAFTSLQNALAVAEAGDAIWVAAGTYRPDGGTGDRDTSFVVTGAQDGLKIYGGFAGGESQRSARDVSGNAPVILSGDIGVVGSPSDNSYHVLRFDGTSTPITTSTRLDGLTVTGGNATGGSSTGTNKGGGLYCDGRGGTCNPTLDAVTFTENAAPGGQGGAVFNDAGSGGTSTPVITNASFTSNSAGMGGAVHNSGGGSGSTSSPTITNTVFRDNTAGTNGGGAIRNVPSNGVASPTITGTTFEQNTTSNGGAGGAIKNETGSNPTIVESVFRNNTADGDGGAIYNEGDGDTAVPVIRRSVFTQNEALATGGESGGGALFNDNGAGSSTPEITNTVFAHNQATNGGAIFNNSSSPTVLNATLTGNVATDQGGALKNYGSTPESTPTLANTILWANTANAGSSDAIYNTTGDAVTLTATIVQGAAIAGGTLSVTDTLQQDPKFRAGPSLDGPDGVLRTADDSLVVQSSSPAVDAGVNTVLDPDGDATREVTTDITGESRVVDDNGDATATVNIGAYEVVADTTPPTINTAVVLDRDADGRLDAVNVTYSEEIDDATVAPSDYTLGGTAFGAVDTSVGTARTVQLQITTDADEVPGTAPVDLTYTPGSTADPAGNLLGEVTSGDVIEVDGAAPVATQFVRSSPASPQTNAGDVTFAVSFSEPVTNLSTAAFGVRGTAGGSISDVSAPSSADTTVTVAVSGEGDLGLTLATDGNIEDSAENSLRLSPPPTDETYTIDYTAPAVVGLSRQAPSSVATNNESVTFGVSFSEPVVNLDATDFALSDTPDGGATIAGVSTPTSGDTTITVNAIAGDGLLTLSLNPEGTSFTDLAGNGYAAFEPPSTGYEIDNTPPAVTAITRSSPPSSQTNASSVTFAVSFSEPLPVIDAGDFALGSTPGGTASIDGITASSSDTTVTVVGLTGDGPLDLDVSGDGTARDAAGNRLDATAPSTEETYAIRRARPTVTAITRASPTADVTNRAQVTFGVSFSDRVQNLDPGAFALSNRPGGSATITGVSTADDTTVAVENVSGNGPLGLNVADGATDVQDLDGNRLDISVTPPTDEAYTIDNLAPSISQFALGARDADDDGAPELVLQFESSEPLDTISATLRRVGGTLLFEGGRASFTETGSGPYTYRHVVDADVTAASYRATLTAAADPAGNGGIGERLVRAIDVTASLAVASPPAPAAGQLGAGPVPLQVSVTNDGDIPLSGIEATVSGPAGGDFAITDGRESAPLAVGETRTYDLAFTPSATGPRTATLALATAEGSSASVALEGRGVRLTVQADEATRGQPVSVTVSIEGGFSPTQAALYVRSGGASSYRKLALPAGSEGRTGTISGALITARGLDYYVRLSTETTTLTVPAGGPAAASADPRHLPVAFESLSPPTAVENSLFQPDTYRMVSVPARPDPGIKAALKAAYGGTYNLDRWRLERWDAAEASYRGYPHLDSLAPGDGFWLTTAEGEPFSLPQGRSPKADTARLLRLDPGWNQIGTPFGFAVPWDTIRAASSVDSTQLDGPVGYADGTFQPGRTTLVPWTGYFVYNATGQPDTLVVPPVGSDTTAKAAPSTPRPEAQLAAARLPGTRPDASPRTAAPDAGPKSAGGRYTLRVEALSAGGSAHAHLGLWPDATAGRGPYDHAQPPAIDDGLRLSALQTVNGRTVPHAYNMKPPRPETGGGRQWTLRLRAPDTGGTRRAKIRLRDRGALPDGHRRYLLDLTAGRRIAPGAELSVRAGESRRLKVIVGTRRYAQKNNEGVSLESLQTALRGNYPNPFSEQTTVEYVIAEEQPVTIEVYDVLGRRVRTLVDDRQALGVHRASLDANRLGSGVYFLRLRAGDASDTKKVMIVK
jgi:predicted outer membrane repeat protein